ncbi:MAG: ABC transporter permease [Dehalococcoidia bacterium]|nr:ABC transporter permease [Dehalococcoidia bacterium]
MRAYVLRRLLLFPVILFAVSVITFSLIRLLPGDAAVARLGAAGAQCDTCFEQVRKELGLDKSKPEQYWIWLKDAIRGDFGLSTSTRTEVSPELRHRLWTTLQLGILAIVFTLLIGIPVGAVSAVRAGSPSDYLLRFFSILGLSVPNFWIGTLVVFMPVIWWGWTPVKDWVDLTDDPGQHFLLLLLPAVVLSISGAAYVARITRSAMLEALSSDHVRTARAKGLWERAVIMRHVLRNSMLTLLTVVGLQFGVILGGSVIIESIFAVPGIGAWIVTAVNNRDYQIVQGVTVVFAAWFLLITLLTDVLYAWVDPRIRY